ncbi:TIGR03826 family flagellar region protein [Rossellomorea sp. BNER]|uniref:TIGR03826 family flagellar region protein n=1 Tax=Rossellomorea sp. BNER TaxID=2962031 RepID=UPI003AF2FC40|nr:hypothetical protein [Rossellomorea sp. BNER]
MGELLNCPACNKIFIKNQFRDVCDQCYKEEEKMYEAVYQFLRKRENRAATIKRVVEVTGVDEQLIHKWVKKRRLQPAHFPNMGYPCDTCGKIINKGKICDDCTSGLKQDLQSFQAQGKWRERIENSSKKTYYSRDLNR